MIKIKGSLIILKIPHRFFSNFHQKDPYQVLQLTRSSSIQEVKDSFRRLAQIYHPDGKQGDSQKFHEIKNAYDHIMNDLMSPPQQQSRSAYKDEPLSQEQIEKEEHMERIRRKIWEEGEKARQIRRMKQQEEQKKREEVERAREMLRQQQTQKQTEYMKMMRQKERQSRSQHKEQLEQLKMEMMKRSNEWQDYSQQDAWKHFDDLMLKQRKEQYKVYEKQQKQLEEQRAIEAQQRIKQREMDAQQQIEKKIQETSFEVDKIRLKIQEQEDSSKVQDLLSVQSKSYIGWLISIAFGSAISYFGYTYFKQKQAQEIQEQQDRIIQDRIEELSNSLVAKKIDKGPDYDSMKTIVLIPIEPAPSDPPWMTKKWAGKKLSSEENDQYCQYKFEKELMELQHRQLSVPGRHIFNKIIEEQDNKKHQCCITYRRCFGKNYLVYDGVFDTCGKINPFSFWNQYVDERKFEQDLQVFMEHYDIPPFDAPTKAEMSINAFFQAKYGMFYCFDSIKRLGHIDYDPGLICQWERNPKQQKKTWSLAVLCAINDKAITYADLSSFQIKDYKKSKKFMQNKNNASKKNQK